MRRDRADRLVAIIVGTTLSLGWLWAWERYQELQAFEGRMGGMMGPMMEGMEVAQGPDPFVIAVGTLVVAGMFGGVYLVLRDELTEGSNQDSQIVTTTEPSPSDIGEPSNRSNGSSGTNSNVTALDRLESQRDLLALLPDDERRILEPSIESPGITQIELRDRADFSKSKVSQTVSELEKRGLVYREKQGRTYRIYPATDVPAVEN